MKRVLLIKTSSMGDIIHTLPALSDAGRQMPGITFDWLVEESYAEIPTWHALVGEVIPIALRRWRKGIFSRSTRREWKRLRAQLQNRRYDLILDAQGLMKSAFLTFLTKGLRVGLDWRSARESMASLAYQRTCSVNFYQHAVIRMRSLFSQALLYPLAGTPADFGFTRQRFLNQQTTEPYLVFLHGTTWTTKEWPEAYWIELGQMANQLGFKIKLSGGTPLEVERAKRIAGKCDAEVYPNLQISEMAAMLANARAVISVDTGFGHLAGALNLPTISLYGPTNPAYTGALGQQAVHLAATFPCAPCMSRVCQFKGASPVTPACFASLRPKQVFAVLQDLLQCHG